MHGSISRKGVMIAIIGFDVLMIATGFLASWVSLENTGLKVFFWMLGNAFFLGVLALVWVNLEDESERCGEVVAHHFKKNATILTALWLCYPFVFIFGHNGLGWLTTAATAGLILFLDVSAKGVYGFISVKGTQKIVDAEAAGRVRNAESGPLGYGTPDPGTAPQPAE